MFNDVDSKEDIAIKTRLPCKKYVCQQLCVVVYLFHQLDAFYIIDVL